LWNGASVKQHCSCTVVLYISDNYIDIRCSGGQGANSPEAGDILCFNWYDFSSNLLHEKHIHFFANHPRGTTAPTAPPGYATESP
jgi:hypothetical protein